MKTQIIQNIKSIIIILAFVVGITYVSAEWTNPTEAPTGGNVPAPINVGYGNQTKQGNLTINSLVSSGVPGTYGLWVVNSPIKAEGGLIIETRTTNPTSPETGRMWLMVQ